MLKISECLEYQNSEEVKPNVLYMGGDPFLLTGRVDFTVFGEISMNGVNIKSTRMVVDLANSAEFVLSKASAVLFHQVPKAVVHPIADSFPLARS